jgi:hypothetical protein
LHFAFRPSPFVIWFSDFAPRPRPLSSAAMTHLTKHEQMVLCVILGLLLTGWAVKAWRTAHPPASPPPAIAPAKP